ncbi:NTP transferase domain-containing protein [Brachybacterium muris]|nr:NTP transferase domain-containing protein [Brachybacterium muris]
MLRPLAGRPVLGWMVRAAQAATEVDDVVVATSTAPGDDAVADLAEELGVAVVRGSEADVLSRFVLALEETDADAVVRLTADCPLADPALISSVAGLWRSDRTLDYAATTLVRTLPRGLDVELASKQALLTAHEEAESFHRTHVTTYLYAGKRSFRTMGLVVQPAANDLRVTLDTVEDGEMLDAVVAELGDRAPAWHEVVDLLRSRPDIARINAEVQQKKLADG